MYWCLGGKGPGELSLFVCCPGELSLCVCVWVCDTESSTIALYEAMQLVSL